MRAILAGLCAAVLAWLAPASLALAEAPPPVHPLTGEDVSAFLDGLLPEAMERGDIAGAVVVVVKDGQVIAKRGYGYADVERRIAVDPDRTLFRPGSTSKLFTWTAVMQQVELGRLDLDADINRYLDFRIPEGRFGRITLRNLMTHTAGFEDRLRDFFVEDPRRLKPFGQALRSAMPARIYPPGQVVAYSNYGAGLAGYIVQRVSGQPFAAYVRDHIFTPLGMASTSMSQPLEPALMARTAKGYALGSDGRPHWYEYTQWPSAGAASTTGPDMARFMIAHLQDGAYGSVRILKPQTARLMHAHAFSPAPGTALNSWALGFYEDSRNGHRVLAHDGGTINFETQLRLVMDGRAGWFLSLSGRGRNGDNNAIEAVMFDRFMDRYFPSPATATEPTLATARADGEALAGTWLPSRRMVSHFMRLSALFDQAQASVDPQGVLTVSAYTEPDGRPVKWREAAPFQWRQVGGRALLVAVRDRQGHVRQIASDLDQTEALLPVPGDVDRGLMLPLLIFGLATTAGAVALWPVNAWLRRRYGRHEDRADRRASWLVHLTALAMAVFVAGWFVLMAKAVDIAAELNERLDPWLRLWQLLGLAGAIGAVLTLVHAIRLWRRPGRSLWVRAGTALVAAAVLGLVWFSVVFRLLWPALG